MEIKFALRAAGAAFAIALAAPAAAHERGETAAPHFEQVIRHSGQVDCCRGCRLCAW